MKKSSTTTGSPLWRLLLAPFLIATSQAQEKAPPAQTPEAPPAVSIPDYIRFSRAADPTHSDKLEVGVGHFEKDGVKVSLVGAVHIGDEGYYRKLNELFKTFDVVLYEMVGQPHPSPGASSLVGPEAPATDGGVRTTMDQVHLVQNIVKSFLKLEFQMDAIDYGAPNFQHADVDWDQFHGLLEKRQQSMFTLIERAMTKSPAGLKIPGLEDDAAAQSTLTTLLNALSAGDSSGLKRTVAPILAETERLIFEVEGEDGTVLVTERNKVVLEKLAVSVAQGHRNIGIFYGAGHMPDLEKRLLAEGFHRTGMDYLTAWDIPQGAPASGSSPLDAVKTLLHDDKVIDSLFDGLRTLLDESPGAGPTQTPGGKAP